MFESRGHSSAAHMQNDTAQQREKSGHDDQQSTEDMWENSDREK